jgi:hypothetical protein
VFLTAVVPQAVKRAKADSAPVDPDRVSNLASAVICGLCDTAATGRWLQQHLDAALLLVSCVPASTFASVSPYCCKLVTLLAPQHSSAGSRLAASAASLALQGAAEDSVSQLMQSARACIAAASDGKPALRVPPLLSTRIVQAAICWLRCNRGLLSMPRTPALSLHLQRQLPAGVAVLLWLNSRESRCEVLAVYAPLPHLFGQSKGDGASAAAWMSLSSQLPPAPS